MADPRELLWYPRRCSMTLSIVDQICSIHQQGQWLVLFGVTQQGVELCHQISFMNDVVRFTWSLEFD